MAEQTKMMPLAMPEHLYKKIRLFRSDPLIAGSEMSGAQVYYAFVLNSIWLILAREN